MICNGTTIAATNERHRIMANDGKQVLLLQYARDICVPTSNMFLPGSKMAVDEAHGRVFNDEASNNTALTNIRDLGFMHCWEAHTLFP